MKKLCLRLVSGVLVSLLLGSGVQAAEMLIPGGQVVGIEMHNDTVTVAALEEGSPAKEAGLLAGDRLVTVDGHPITGADDVKAALERSGGSVQVTVSRGKENLTFRVEPQSTPQGPKLGPCHSCRRSSPDRCLWH